MLRGCFAITCNPVPWNAPALGPTEVRIQWVIWRLVRVRVLMCVCVFPAAPHAPRCTLMWADSSELRFVVDKVITVQLIYAPLHCLGIYCIIKKMKGDYDSSVHLLNTSSQPA